MDELDNNQLILLALLVSFVTSIATGIATVSLIEQAPSDVTRVINRVVERTVETVVPAQGASVITKEKTVIVKEEDAIASSIATISKSLASISTFDSEGKEVFLGLGFVGPNGKYIITDSTLVSEDGKYFLKFAGGATTTATTLLQDEGKKLAILETGGSAKMTPTVFADNSSLRLGQTVMTVSSREMNTIATGIISHLVVKELPVPEDSEEKPKEIVESIKTNIEKTSYVKGTPLINLFGEVIGIAVGEGESFYSMQVIESFLKTTSSEEGEDGSA